MRIEIETENMDEAGEAGLLRRILGIVTDTNQRVRALTQQEGNSMSALTDQITQLKQSEDAEHQAVADAIARVNTQLDSLAAANPDLAAAIGNIQADTAALAAVAVAAPPTPAPLPTPTPPPSDGGSTGSTGGTTPVTAGDAGSATG